MKPNIDGTEFGSITIDGDEYEHDVIIRLSREVKKRKKKLSKAQYGTSHTVSLEEAEYIYDDGAERLIIGTGQTGQVELSKEAAVFFRENGCTVEMSPTPRALNAWNAAKGKVIGMFHVTC